MTRSVLVLRHVPHEGLGTIEEHLARAGLAPRYFDLFAEVPRQLPLEQAAGLIVMGGPMNVDETHLYPFLQPEVEWIREALVRQVPLLGVCLGSQLLAKSLGAKVYPNGIKEIGWYDLELTPQAADDPLFGGCATRQTVFQWHGDTFDLPPGAVHLARSERCKHQAFRYGPSAFGLQFHIEMTPSLLESWLSEPGNCCELAGLDYIEPERIRAETPARFPEMTTLGAKVLSRFAGLCARYSSRSA